MANERAFELGVDIGGTFTDFVLRDRETGDLYLNKVLTTPDDPSRGVLEGVRQLFESRGIGASSLRLVVHGTTLMTNALIERRGAVTALLTTAGYRDVLDMGTELRYDSYDLAMEKPQPLVPRRLRFDVPERLNNTGKVLRSLDEARVTEIAKEMRDARVDSVAICYLHSFRNPGHEQKTREIIERLLPEVSVSISSEVAPEIREYPRMSTTAANAYVKPLASRYLGRLERELNALGYESELFMMLSSGGITNAAIASRYPIQLVESGPAGGAICAAAHARRIGREEVLSFDMGGTTAKMAYITEGSPQLARAFEVARVSRFRMGSGLPIQIPVIEMLEIGAGGGSIAYRDDLGLLKVGPRSAGAVPGPACYGFGGEEPTVTDANVVLGYLDPDGFLGGGMELDREAATAAIARVAGPLNLELIEAAMGIFQVVNENMISATKVHIAENGKDPRRASLVAFGGAGPIHAHAIARALGMREVICPLRAGVASALGFLTAPISFDLAQSLAAAAEALEFGAFEAIFKEMEVRGTHLVTSAGVQGDEVHHLRSVDVRFVGQGHEIEVGLPDEVFERRELEAIEELFHKQYAELFGQVHRGVAMEIVTCRVKSSGPAPDLRLPMVSKTSGSLGERAAKGSRRVYFGATAGFVETRVYDRYGLVADDEIRGPAVVEERESTVVIPPEMVGRVDGYGNVIISTNGQV